MRREELIPLHRRWHLRASGSGSYWGNYDFAPSPDNDSVLLSLGLHPLLDLLQKPCLFLLGQGGAGKTAESKMHFASERLPDESIIAFEARELDGAGAESIFRSPEWRSALDGRKPIRLVFDSVDEALLGRGTFLDGLRRELAIAKASAESRKLALSLVLTCRLEWDEKVAGEIADIWGINAADCTYQLAPLSLPDALALAAHRGVQKPQDLAEAWARADMENYARWPRTLGWLADEFVRDGKISSTLTKLHEGRCSRQFEDAARLDRNIGKLTPERMERWNEAVRFLASAAIATGTQRFVVGRPAGEKEMDVAALAAAVAKWPDAARIPPNREAFVDAMKHGDLFAPVEGAWAFQEQSDTEFLAAQRLARLPIEQLAGFFGSETPNGWQVFQHHYATAAMTAIASNEFRDWLLSRDPLVLIRADAAVLPDSEKARIVDALLDLIESGRAPDAHEHESHFQTLRHRKLAEQLRPWLGDAHRRPEAREMALRIAAACADKDLAVELSEDIWQLASGTEAEKLSWLPMAVGTIGIHWPKARLMRIVTGEVSPGRYWSTRGAALFALFHRSRQTLHENEQGRLSEVVASFTRNPTGVGSNYDFFLHGCHEHLRGNDADEVCAVLAELRDWNNVLDEVSPLYKLAFATLRAAVNLLPNGQVLSALTDWWFAAMQRNDHRIPGQHHTRSLAEIGLDAPEKRRVLLTALLRHPRAVTFSDSGLHELPVLPDDWPWLLDRLPQLSGNEEKLAARLIAQRIHNSSLREQNLDALRIAFAASSELRSLLPPAPDGDIHKTLLHIEEESERRWATESAKVKRRVKERPQYDAAAEFARALEGCAKGDPLWWPWLIHAASEPEPNGSVRLWEAGQPQELPGWKKIPDDALVHVRAAARDYVIHHPPELSARNQSHLGMEATRHALCLLRDSLASDADLRAAFRPEWVEVVLRHLHPEREPLPSLLATLHLLAPKNTLDCIRAQLEFEWNENRWMRADYLDALFPAVRGVFIDILGRSPVRVEGYHSGITWLMRHDRPAAAELALQRCAELAPQERSDGRSVAIGTALLAFPEHWQRVWPYIAADPTDGLSCLGSVARASEHNGWQNALFGDLPENTDFIATLYGWLLKTLPPERENRGVYTPSGIDHCRDLERRCYQALVNAGRADLLRQAFAFAGVDDRRWTQSAAKKAERNAQARQWQPWRIETFVEWLSTNGGTRITDNDSLHRAVVASLRGFEQAWRSGEVPPVQLWDLDAKIPRREKFLSEALKQHLKRNLEPRIVPKGACLFVVREQEWATGEKADLLIQMTLADGSKPSVVVEVKLCDHADVETSMETQLAARYLREKNLTHGIYFVGWFGCSAWPSKPKAFQKLTLTKARRQLEKQAATISRNGLSITAIVAPCPLPAILASRRTKTKSPAKTKSVTRR